MKKRPPLLLMLIVGFYLLLEAAFLVSHPEPAKAIRLLIAAAIGFFMLRGNSVAIFIWASLSFLAAAYGFAVAFKASQTNLPTAVIGVASGTVALSQALYLVLSRSVRTYVAKA